MFFIIYIFENVEGNVKYDHFGFLYLVRDFCLKIWPQESNKQFWKSVKYGIFDMFDTLDEISVKMKTHCKQEWQKTYFLDLLYSPLKMHNQSFTFLIRHCNFTFFYTTHFYIQRHVTPKNHVICNTEQIENSSFQYQSVSCTQMKTPRKKNVPLWKSW